LSEQFIRPRIAASSYLNTAPLIWSFLHGPESDAVELLTDESPAHCADLLARGEVDVALVPVIEYQRIPDILIVPGVCVGSQAEVRSVVLASKPDDLKRVRCVALDDSSRTSVALVKIIFREFLGFEPEWRIMRPDLNTMLNENDAALIIGDPAMKVQPGALSVFDLATLWHRYTNLGFVFAMWMARESGAERVRAIDFAGARDEGLANMNKIVASYETSLGLPRGELESYLTRNISFRIDRELIEGLELFFDLAYRHRLIDERRNLKMLC